MSERPDDWPDQAAGQWSGRWGSHWADEWADRDLAQDDLVRSGLGLLREDARITVLPGAAGIRARGDARRRRARLGWASVGAAATLTAALAAVAVGTLVWPHEPEPRVVPGVTQADPTATSSRPESGGSTAALGAARGEGDMPVAGPPGDVPESRLFVDPRRWSSLGITAGSPTRALAVEFEGSAAVTSCDADTGSSGRFGIIAVQDVGTGWSVGQQRVRSFEPDGTPPAQQVRGYLRELGRALLDGCATENVRVTATPGPVDGTYRLRTRFVDGSPSLTEWVAVTGTASGAHAATVVVTSVADEAGAWRELARLQRLAALR